MDKTSITFQKDFQTQIKNPLEGAKKKKENFVNIKASSWKSKYAYLKLYDYKAQKTEYFPQNFKILENVTIFRNKENYYSSIQKQQSKQQQVNQAKIPIFNVKFNENSKTFLFQPIDSKSFGQNQDFQQDVFLVINSNKNNNSNSLGYNIHVGDIIKFGYTKYLVFQINNSKKTKSIAQISRTQKKNQIYLAQQKVEENSQCKICYSKEHSQTNPLINPCNCNGHSKYTHLQCLRPWVNHKVKNKCQINGIVITFDYDKLKCEICKQKLPQIIKLTNQEQIFFLDFKKPNQPYLLLKSLTQKQSDSEKLHFICPQNGIIKVGRSENCDLIQSKQTTVSRDHAQIEFRKDKFYLRDLQSKFGTLIKFQKGIQLKSKQQIRLQYKNTMYTISVNKTSSN